MTTGVTGLGTIVGVWAHPDDETYLTGGIMALARRGGQRVVCVTATRGEKGSQDENRWPPATIAQTREAELAAALAVLGVEEHRWLDFVDGECDSVDDAEATSKLARIFDEVDPDTILTFGPDGQTGHPDHLAVHRWTMDAWKASGGRARVAWAVVPQGWEEFAEKLNEFDVFAPGTPVFVPAEDLDVHVVVEGELMDLKLRALREQTSQTEGLLAALGEGFLRRALADESFSSGSSA